MNAVSLPSSLEEEAVVDSISALARRELNALAIDRAGCMPPHVLKALAEVGVFGLTLPRPFGGFGAGLPLATRVIEALAKVDRSVATTVGLHLGLGTRALVRYGTSELQEALLPALSSGEAIAAFATTEPGSGSDLSKLGTRVSSQGDSLRLSGEKAYVTNGGIAQLITVTARCEESVALEKGMAMLMLPTNTQGISRRKEEHKLGLRGSSTTGFLFDAVEVPRPHLLGSPATGSAQIEHTLSWGRTLMSAGCVGAAASALERARSYTEMRRQFGRTLATQPVVRGQLGRSVVMVSTMRALVAATAEATTDAELHRLSVSAKIFCSEETGHVVDTALQLHGASGYMEDTGLALLWRDVRVTRIFEGANDVLLTHAGSLEVLNPRKYPEVPLLAQPAVRAVHRQLQSIKSSLGVRVFARPEILHNLGSAVVWRDAVISGCRAFSEEAWQRILAEEASLRIRSAHRGRHHRDDVEVVLQETR